MGQRVGHASGPVGFAFGNVDDVLLEAARSAVVTHDHAEGIKGAQAIALAVFLARSGAPKDQIRRDLVQRFGYDLDRTRADSTQLSVGRVVPGICP